LTVTPVDVAEEPLILFRSGYFMHDLAFEILGRGELNVVYFTDNTESVKRMIVAGLGITILPLFSVYPDVLTKNGDISYIPLTGDLTTLSLNVIRRRHGYASRAVRELWSDLVAEAARASASGRHVPPSTPRPLSETP
jgi:DNA-binding transcriptional LysR family regulator